MQGVQPRANTTPSTGAAARPAAGSRWIRRSALPRLITPAKASPSTMITTPSTRVITDW